MVFRKNLDSKSCLTFISLCNIGMIWIMINQYFSIMNKKSTNHLNEQRPVSYKDNEWGMEQLTSKWIIKTEKEIMDMSKMPPRDCTLSTLCFNDFSPMPKSLNIFFLFLDTFILLHIHSSKEVMQQRRDRKQLN